MKYFYTEEHDVEAGIDIRVESLAKVENNTMYIYKTTYLSNSNDVIVSFTVSVLTLPRDAQKIFEKLNGLTKEEFMRKYDAFYNSLMQSLNSN